MPRLSIHSYIVAVLLLCAGSFTLYATKSLRSGPKIRVSSPLAYSSVDVPVRVIGKIDKPKSATINGATLLVTRDGSFAVDVILTPPLDSIDIWAVNAYGKESILRLPVAVSE